MKLTLEFEPNRITRRIGGIAMKTIPAVKRKKEQCKSGLKRAGSQSICTLRNLQSKTQNLFAKTTTE